MQVDRGKLGKFSVLGVLVQRHGAVVESLHASIERVRQQSSRRA
jgi:hypothetical protein